MRYAAYMENRFKTMDELGSFLGFKTFPVYKDAKIPETPDGFKSATTHPLEAWANYGEQGNYGVAAGEASNITVLDFDGPEGLATLQELSTKSGYDLSSYTFSVSTPGGGKHLYFKHTPNVKTTVKLLTNLDIRNDGSYVVGPGSTIGEKTYELGDELEIKPMPPTLTNILLEAARRPSIASTKNSEGLVPEGGRNHYLTQLAGSMRRKGMSPEAMEAALLVENEQRLEEPLPEWEVRRIASSVGRYAPSDDAAETSPSSSPQATSRGAAAAADAFKQAGRLVRASEYTDSMTAYLKNKDLVKGRPTGFDGLDRLLGGGKRLGEVTCWHAEAKTGKNTLWHYLMYLQLELGVPQAYASRELSPDTEVVPNLMSVSFGENSWLVDMTEDKAAQYKSKVNEWPLFFTEGYGYFPLEAIVEWVQQGKAAGIEYYWFDHLHYMLEDPEDHKAASKLIKELKTLAKQQNIHIDIIIQPNKLSDGQKLSLNSIKGGAAMGQAIDNLIILERVKQTDVKNISKLTLEVGRSKLCRTGSIYLAFDLDSTRFAETEAMDERSVITREADDGIDRPRIQERPEHSPEAAVKYVERLMKGSLGYNNMADKQLKS